MRDLRKTHLLYRRCRYMTGLCRKKNNGGKLYRYHLYGEIVVVNAGCKREEGGTEPEANYPCLGVLKSIIKSVLRKKKKKGKAMRTRFTLASCYFYFQILHI